jgi:hypothetical protein
MSYKVASLQMSDLGLVSYRGLFHSFYFCFCFLDLHTAKSGARHHHVQADDAILSEEMSFRGFVALPLLVCMEAISTASQLEGG